MSTKTTIEVTVPAGTTATNVLVNSKFQYSAGPGPNGIVGVSLSGTAEVAGQTFDATVDKDFVSEERMFVSADPAKMNENPGLDMMTEPGSQIIVDVQNDDIVSRTYLITVENRPI